jgi:hypothetical protein
LCVCDITINPYRYVQLDWHKKVTSLWNVDMFHSILLHFNSIIDQLATTQCHPCETLSCFIPSSMLFVITLSINWEHLIVILGRHCHVPLQHFQALLWPVSRYLFPPHLHDSVRPVTCFHMLSACCSPSPLPNPTVSSLMLFPEDTWCCYHIFHPMTCLCLSLLCLLCDIYSIIPLCHDTCCSLSPCHHRCW